MVNGIGADLAHESPPRWSFITVTYNSEDLIESHWRATRPSDVEWIVVDNSSSDGSAELAESLGAVVIRLEKNVGFGAANNVGFARARGEFVAFVNPDLRVDFSSLATLELSLARDPGLIAPQLVYPDGRLQPSGRDTPSFIHKVRSRLGVHAATDAYYIYAREGEERYVAWFIGAAVIGRRHELEMLGERGPWDERFFVYYEDSDIGLRAWQTGLTVRVVGDVRWEHSWSRDTTLFRIRPWAMEFGSMWKFYTRYPGMIFRSDGGRRFRALRASHWGRTTELVGSARGVDK